MTTNKLYELTSISPAFGEMWTRRIANTLAWLLVVLIAVLGTTSTPLLILAATQAITLVFNFRVAYWLAVLEIAFLVMGMLSTVFYPPEEIGEPHLPLSVRFTLYLIFVTFAVAGAGACIDYSIQLGTKPIAEKA